MPLQKNKFRFSYNEVLSKYTANSQNTHAKVWPQQNFIATLLKSHFGMEATLQTRRLLLVRRLMKDRFWKENRIYERIYIYIHNTNMMKYCAINLTERYRFSFKYSRDNAYVSSKNIIDFLQHMYLHWHYFIKNSSRWSLKMWKNWKYFNGTAISTFLVLMKAVVLVILALNLNGSEYVTVWIIFLILS